MGSLEVLPGDSVRYDGDAVRRTGAGGEQFLADLLAHRDHVIGASRERPVEQPADALERRPQRSGDIVRKLTLQQGMGVEDDWDGPPPSGRQGDQQPFEMMGMNHVEVFPIEEPAQPAGQQRVQDQELLDTRSGRNLSIARY